MVDDRFKTHPNLLHALHLIERAHEVLLLLRRVAGQAAIEVFLVVHRLVGVERLVFPFPVALLGRVLGTPARALLQTYRKSSPSL